MVLIILCRSLSSLLIQCENVEHLIKSFSDPTLSYFLCLWAPFAFIIVLMSLLLISKLFKLHKFSRKLVTNYFQIWNYHHNANLIDLHNLNMQRGLGLQVNLPKKLRRRVKLFQLIPIPCCLQSKDNNHQKRRCVRFYFLFLCRHHCKRRETKVQTSARRRNPFSNYPKWKDFISEHPPWGQQAEWNGVYGKKSVLMPAQLLQLK